MIKRRAEQRFEESKSEDRFLNIDSRGNQSRNYANNNPANLSETTSKISDDTIRITSERRRRMIEKHGRIIKGGNKARTARKIYLEESNIEIEEVTLSPKHIRKEKIYR